MNKILYLHGLDSVPSEEKIEVMRNIFDAEILAPKQDYYSSENNIKLYWKLNNLARKEKIELVIGSSFGGYMAFYINETSYIPTILFNPAVHSRTIEVPVAYVRSDSYKTIILGKNDGIIDPDKTIKFMKDHNYRNYDIVLADVGHRIPPAQFEELLIQVYNKFNQKISSRIV